MGKGIVCESEFLFFSPLTWNIGIYTRDAFGLSPLPRGGEGQGEGVEWFVDVVFPIGLL
jgi:hypothetical protein